jgi:hypothetical protein
MPEFDWGKYENQTPEFDWNQYETPKPLKATDADKDEAFKMIKAQHPNMPEFVIRALLPMATKMAETPKDNSPGTATGAFLRSAVRTPLEGAENLASLIGLPVNKNAKWPDLIAESESDKSHPFAELGGSMAGLLAPGAGSVAALRSIPMWGKIVEKAAPSLLRRLPVYGAEGAALGAGFSPEGHRGEGALTGAALGAAGSVIPSAGRGFMKLKDRISSLRNLDRLKSEGKITEEQYQTAINDEEALKELSKSQGLGADVNKMEAELPELQQQANQLGEEVQGIPKVNTENMLGSPSGEELVPQAESLLKTEQQKSAQAENQLANHLYKGYEHGVPIAESVVNEIEGIPVKGSNRRMGGVKKEIGSQYDTIEENLKDQNIVIPRDETLKEIETQARKSLENSKGFFKNDAEYEKTVKQIVEQMKPSTKGNDIIPAADVLSNYRSLKNMSQKIRTKAFSREVAGNKDLQKDMLAQAEEMEGNADSLEQLMESHDLGSELENLKSANKRWREEIAPLYKNSTYQTFLNKGYAPSKDLIYNLRGNGPGQEIIRNIIKKNPTLVRSILGQRYADKPANIHEFDQLAQEFIEAAPEETRNLIKGHRESLANVDQAKAEHEAAKHVAEQMKSESERVKRSFEEEKKTQEKRSKKEVALKEIQDKIAAYQRNIPELKKKAKVKNISLQKKLELESKIARAEKDRDKLINRAIGIGLGVAGTGLADVYLTKKINSSY